MADPFSGGIMPQVIQNRQGLQNLQAQQQEMQRLQQQQQMQDEGMRLLEQYQAGLQQGKPDQSLLHSAVLKSPTAAQNVLNAVGIVDKQQKTQAATDVVTLMSAIDNPQAFFKAVAQRSAAIKARGGDPSDTLEMAKRYQAGDAAGVKNDLMIAGAALANEGLLKPELIGLGVKPEGLTPYQQAQLGLREREVAASELRATRPDTQVTVENKQDSEIAKLSAKDYQNLIGRAAAANKEIATISTLENLSGKAFSGAGAGALLQGAKVLKQLGIETEGLQESEVYEKLANTLVLDKSQQMSGALSNADMTFLQNTVPSLNTSKEGRKLTFEISRKLAEREKQVAKLATEYRRNNKGAFDMGEFQMYLDEWKEQNPLFEKEAARPAPADLTDDDIMKQYGLQ